jgi:hypothetical protein
LHLPITFGRQIKNHKMKVAFFLVALCISCVSCGLAQKNGTDAAGIVNKPDSLATPGVMEYLGASGPYTVGEYVFHLRWSDHPGEDIYIQDYVPTRYDHQWYNQLVRIELLLDNTKPKEALNAKIKELESEKYAYAVVTHTTSTDPKTGVDILQYLVSPKEPGNNNIAEWDVIRYVPYKGDKDQKGVEIFTYSRRDYGMRMYPFVSEIERDSVKFKGFFMAVPVPDVRVK